MALYSLASSQKPGSVVQPQPRRLHHAAYVSADQERTRHFYEDVLGMPLVAFWIEQNELDGVPHSYSHAFYGLADGSALAFFNFADPEQQQVYAAKKQSLFVHLAMETDQQTQDGIRARLEEAGIAYMHMDHGFCVSIYVEDPDGQLVEFTVDAPQAAAVDLWQRRSAHDALHRWRTGDRTPNNDLRSHD